MINKRSFIIWFLGSSLTIHAQIQIPSTSNSNGSSNNLVVGNEILPANQDANYRAEISTCDESGNRVKIVQKTSQTTSLVNKRIFEPIELSPNPARESVFVLAQKQNIKQCRVYDQSGRLLDLPFKWVSEAKIMLDVSALSDGLYVVEVMTTLEIERLKLIIE